MARHSAAPSAVTLNSSASGGTYRIAQCSAMDSPIAPSSHGLRQGGSCAPAPPQVSPPCCGSLHGRCDRAAAVAHAARVSPAALAATGRATAAACQLGRAVRQGRPAACSAARSSEGGRLALEQRQAAAAAPGASPAAHPHAQACGPPRRRAARGQRGAACPRAPGAPGTRSRAGCKSKKKDKRPTREKDRPTEESSATKGTLGFAAGAGAGARARGPRGRACSSELFSDSALSALNISTTTSTVIATVPGRRSRKTAHASALAHAVLRVSWCQLSRGPSCGAARAPLGACRGDSSLVHGSGQRRAGTQGRACQGRCRCPCPRGRPAPEAPSAALPATHYCAFTVTHMRLAAAAGSGGAVRRAHAGAPELIAPRPAALRGRRAQHATHRERQEPPAEAGHGRAADIEADDSVAHDQPAIDDALLLPAARRARARVSGRCSVGRRLPRPPLPARTRCTAEHLSRRQQLPTALTARHEPLRACSRAWRRSSCSMRRKRTRAIHLCMYSCAGFHIRRAGAAVLPQGRRRACAGARA